MQRLSMKLLKYKIICHFKRKYKKKPIIFFYIFVQFYFRPQKVGECIADIVIINKNGSIWLIDDGKYSEITLTKYWNK